LPALKVRSARLTLSKLFGVLFGGIKIPVIFDPAIIFSQASDPSQKRVEQLRFKLGFRRNAENSLLARAERSASLPATLKAKRSRSGRLHGD
jgi:hypothetical protein